MKSVTYKRYGTAEVLELVEIQVPAVADDQVLLKVLAVSINPADWHFMRGTPYLIRLQTGLLKPKSGSFGLDMAGVVEAVGKNVSEFRVGDEVFGEGRGGLSEFAVISKDKLVNKPTNLSFEAAAAVPMAGFTALQALRDKGRIQAGQKVLIVGASGGVGTFAVQIAKSYGAVVTGVCSTRNREMVKSIGADHVIDYSKEEFSDSNVKFDLIVQTAGNYSLRNLRRVLAPAGTLVLAGDSSGTKAVLGMGFVFGMLRTAVISRFSKQSIPAFLARRNKADLIVLKELIEEGKLTPVIDKTYPMVEISDAVEYLETGHARGKVVIKI